MNIYGYDSSNKKDYNELLLNIVSSGDFKLEDDKIIYNDIINRRWVINNQEYFWITHNNSKEHIPYLRYRHEFYKSYSEPNYDEERKFPLYVVVEPSSLCNLRCSMCFQQDSRIRETPYKGSMDFALYKKIIDESYENRVNAVTIAGRGEPLTNPQIGDMIEYSGNKFFELKINTNGLLLNEKICRTIVESKVAMVVFSAEGTNQEEYGKTRVGGNLKKLLNNIIMFNRVRAEYSDAVTLTRISGVIAPDIEYNERSFYEFWKSYVDEVTVGVCEERWDTYNNSKANNLVQCYRLWERLYILWNGDCIPCDVDYLEKLNLGKVSNNCTIESIWNGERLKIIREMHNSGQRYDCIPCDRCGV